MIIRKAAVLTITLATLWMFPLAPETFLNLHQVGWQVFTNRSKTSNILAELSRPQGGETTVLPEDVQVMIAQLRTSRADSFRYSPAIGGDYKIQQRLVEGAYPLQYSTASHFYLCFEQEHLPPNYRLITNTSGVCLAYCP